MAIRSCKHVFVEEYFFANKKSPDPETRYTLNKKAVCNFTLACNREWKDREGELRSQADFIPVVVWGPQAENCGRYLRKGHSVLVNGRIQVRNYEDKSGTKKYVTEVIAQEVVFISGKGNKTQMDVGTKEHDENKNRYHGEDKDNSEYVVFPETEEEDTIIPF